MTTGMLLRFCRLLFYRHPTLTGVVTRGARLQRRLEAFGRAVRAERDRRGLSQEALADLAGLHRTYIGSIERGERNISLGNAYALADTLGVSIAELLANGR